MALYELFSTNRYTSPGTIVGLTVTAVLTTAAAGAVFVPVIGAAISIVLGLAAALVSLLTSWFAADECEVRQNKLNVGCSDDGDDPERPCFSSAGIRQDHKMREFVAETRGNCDLMMKRLMTIDFEGDDRVDDDGNTVTYAVPSGVSGYEKLYLVIQVLLTGRWWDRT